MNKRYVIILIGGLIILTGAVGALIYPNHDTARDMNKSIQATSQEQRKRDIREAIWSQLSLQQQERINGRWKDAKALRVTLRDGMANSDNDTYKSYIGKEVYLVDFPTKDRNKNMLIYADRNTFEIIGYGSID